MSNVVDVQQVLFICTGNYYRSRFAELLFNAAARERGLPWRAISRGTDVFGAGRFNVGPISNVARQALEARGVPLDASLRLPLPLTEGDLTAADLIVAVCEAEHRPHLERDFPAAAARVEYWGVEDLAVTPAEDALATLERHVTALLDRLAQSRDR
jgi:protein-tyrosine phosphatase